MEAFYLLSFDFNDIFQNFRKNKKKKKVLDFIIFDGNTSKNWNPDFGYVLLPDPSLITDRSRRLWKKYVSHNKVV